MRFIKKHYEKVLLGAVLLFLAVAVALLPIMISGKQVYLETMRQEIIRKPVTPLPALDLSRLRATLEHAKEPADLILSAPPHNLFNPVPWQQTSDKKLIKVATGSEVGPAAVVVTKISPLYLTITFDSVGASGSNYLIAVERETEVSPNKRKISRYVALGNKTEVFTLRDVKGPADNPTDVILELNDSQEQTAISTNRPYRRVDGYMVDLKYDPENKKWQNRRMGATLSFAGDDYTVAAINLIATNQFEVVLSAKSSGKKNTIKYNTAP